MKAKKIIIAIVAILVVLGGTFAGLWFFTDVFNFLKPANDVFSNQIQKALNLEGAKFSNYSDFLKEYKEMSNKPVSSKINMSANLNISELDSDIQDTINKSELRMEAYSDTSNKKSQSKIGLFTNNSEVLTLDLVQNDSTIGIGCKDLYDKYVAVKMEDLIKYIGEQSDLSSSELDTLLNSSLSSIDPYELLYISDDDLKHFDDTYKDCLEKLISKDCYSTEKNVEVEVDDKDVKTTAYYLTLTGKDAYDFLDKLTGLIKDDDVLCKIIAEKVNLILGASSQDKISDEKVKDVIEQLTSSMLEELESMKDATDSAIQIAVYSDNSNPVRIELNILDDVEQSDDKETVFTIEYAKNKTLYKIFNGKTELISLVNEYTKNSDEEKAGKFEAKYSGSSVGTLEYELIDKKDESKIDLSLDIPLADISADIEISTKGDYKKEDVQLEGSISFKYKRESAEIKFDGSMNYGDVSIPELTSGNSVNVFDLSEEDAQKLVSEILTNANSVLPSRLKLIGIDVDKDFLLPSSATPTTDVNEDDDMNINEDENATNTEENATILDETIPNIN